MVFVERHKAKQFGVEIEFDFADGAMTVFCDDELGYVCRDEVRFVLVIIIDTVEEHDHIGVLLDGAGFAKVGENRTRVVTAGYGTGELSKGDNRDFQFASELFQAAGNFCNFLDAVSGITIGTLEKLEIVDDNHADVMVMGSTTGFVAEFENGH